MPVISTSTFDPLKRYVRVRLAQGVPIVDADVNERDDIHMFELRAFLKWFVGNGVPEGNDGFRVRSSATNPATNFTIGAGVAGMPDALGNVGRCLVDGQDVIIAADVEFQNQPLHESQGGSTALAAQWNVPKISALVAAAGVVCVYLDVWERTVTSSEDAALVPLGLGIESCQRVKREWVVRTVAAPQPPAPAAGHAHYAIALVNHTGGAITAGDITDLREQRLLVPPSTLITDVFGGTVLDYRRGRGRPPISFREAINALIRGDVPTLPEVTVGTDPGSDTISRGIFFDAAGGLVTTWMSNRTGTNHVFAARLAPGASLATLAAAQRLTGPAGVGGAPATSWPHAVPLPDGGVLVTYEQSNNIMLKHGALATLVPGSAEVTVANSPETESRPFALQVGGAGGHVLLMWHRGTAVNRWEYARFTPSTNTLSGKADLSATVTTGVPLPQLHAAKDSADAVWAAFVAPSSGAPAGNNIRVMKIPNGGVPGSPTAPATLTGDELGTGGADQNPFVLIDKTNTPWVFFSANGTAIHYQRFVGGVWEAVAMVPGSSVGTTNASPAAALDRDGTIWLFWHRLDGVAEDVWYSRRGAGASGWTEPRAITGTADPDTNAFAVADANGILWMFWNRSTGGNNDLWLKRIVTSV